MFADTSQTRAQLLATAEREGPESQNNLGIIYMATVDGAANDEAAAECFRGAAERGYAPAQYNLALLYERGQGVACDAQQARKWFVRAAGLGDPAAQFHLGLHSHRKSMDPANGDSPECRVEALKWLSLAAEHGYHNAETLCGSLILSMSVTQVSESSRRAAAFKTEPRTANHSLPSTA